MGQDNEDEEEQEDSDFEITAGDMNLYDSKLEEIDEILYLRDTMMTIGADQNLYEYIVGSNDVSELMNYF